MSNAYHEPYIGLILPVVCGGVPQTTIVNHKQNLVYFSKRLWSALELTLSSGKIREELNANILQFGPLIYGN